MNAAGSVQERLGVPAPGGSFWSLTGPGTDRPPIPSQAIIKGIGDVAGAPLELGPNASLPMRVADYALPFFVAGGGNAASRIGEAKGLVNKAAEFLGYGTGAAADAALTYGGSQLGQNYIGGPEGALIGSLFGGGARPIAQRTLANMGRNIPELTSPSASQIFDASMNPQGPNVLPTFGQIAGPGGKQFEKAVGSIPILRSGVNAARAASEQGINQSIAAGVDEVRGSSSTPTKGPVSPDTTAGRIIDLSRAMNASEGQRVSAQQQALEDAIGSNTPVNVLPVAQTLTSLAKAPTTGPAATRALNPRIDDLNEMVDRQNPPPVPGLSTAYPPTAAYGGVKDLRSDLGSRSANAEPLQGHYLDQAYDAYTGAMRDTAVQAGQGPQFDAANLDYSTFKKVNQPWLERQGGSLEPGSAQPAPSTIASRVNAIPGASPGYLTEIENQLGPEAARATAADVLSRLGQVRGQPTPTKWGSDYASVNQAMKDFINSHAPVATPYLENAATAGQAFDIQPERPGMSNTLGFLGSLGESLAKIPRTAIGVSGALETPSIIRALGGGTNIPALIAQYAQRQGVAAGMRP
jgi:hypothetical protein